MHEFSALLQGESVDHRYPSFNGTRALSQPKWALTASGIARRAASETLCASLGEKVRNEKLVPYATSITWSSNRSVIGRADNNPNIRVQLHPARLPGAGSARRIEDALSSAIL